MKTKTMFLVLLLWSQPCLAERGELPYQGVAYWWDNGLRVERVEYYPRIFPKDRDFAGLDFRDRRLKGANFRDSNAAGCNFSSTDLAGADFENAALRGSNFHGANASDARFVEADLFEADLTDAKLSGSDLRGADLNESRLDGADFRDTNMEGVIFQPKLDSIPEARRFVGAKNLHKMRFLYKVHPLVELRERFRKAGMERESREITYAINHVFLAWGHGIVGSLLRGTKTVLFEWTTGWGLYPERALLILIVSVLLFGMAYGCLAMMNAGIVSVTDDQEEEHGPHRTRSGHEGSHWQEAIVGGMCLSSIRTIAIGGVIPIGRLIDEPLRSQREVILVSALGRKMMVFQSIIVMTLLTLWVLSRFFQPFF